MGIYLLESETEIEIICPDCKGSGVDPDHEERDDDMFNPFAGCCRTCEGGSTIWVKKSTLSPKPVCSYIDVFEDQRMMGLFKRYHISNPHTIVESDRSIGTEFHIRGLGVIEVRGWGTNPDTGEYFFMCYLVYKEIKSHA